jgi:hypothetical protein
MDNGTYRTDVLQRASRSDAVAERIRSNCSLFWSLRALTFILPSAGGHSFCGGATQASDFPFGAPNTYMSQHNAYRATVAAIFPAEVASQSWELLHASSGRLQIVATPGLINSIESEKKCVGSNLKNVFVHCASTSG